MNDPKYLRMQADSLETKGDRLFDLNRTVEAKRLYDEAEALRKQAADLEVERESEPKVQGRLFESYAGLPDEDEFADEDEDNPFVACEKCGWEEQIHSATLLLCSKCGSIYCQKCAKEFMPDYAPEVHGQLIDSCEKCREKISLGP
jgi:hypothetical protein